MDKRSAVPCSSEGDKWASRWARGAPNCLRPTPAACLHSASFYSHPSHFFLALAFSHLSTFPTLRSPIGNLLRKDLLLERGGWEWPGRLVAQESVASRLCPQQTWAHFHGGGVLWSLGVSDRLRVASSGFAEVQCWGLPKEESQGICIQLPGKGFFSAEYKWLYSTGIQTLQATPPSRC